MTCESTTLMIETLSYGMSIKIQEHYFVLQKASVCFKRLTSLDLKLFLMS